LKIGGFINYYKIKVLKVGKCKSILIYVYWAKY